MIRLHPLVIVFFVLLVLGALLNHHQKTVNTLRSHLYKGERINRRLVRTLQDRAKLGYLAVNYGQDVRDDPSRRLLPLEGFVLPVKPGPLWIQADDALIQVLQEGDTLRIDAFRVVADTAAAYRDLTLFPGTDSL